MVLGLNWCPLYNIFLRKQGLHIESSYENSEILIIYDMIKIIRKIFQPASSSLSRRKFWCGNDQWGKRRKCNIFVITMTDEMLQKKNLFACLDKLILLIRKRIKNHIPAFFFCIYQNIKNLCGTKFHNKCTKCLHASS